MRAAIRRRLVAAGASTLVRFAKRSKLRILSYGRFSGDEQLLHDTLTRHFRHLRDHYQPVSLDEIAECLEAGRPFPDRALAVTIDDGYDDFRRVWPLLRSFVLPATLYAVPEFLDRKVWLWRDVVDFCFAQSPLPRLTVRLPDETLFACKLPNREDRREAARDLSRMLMRKPDAIRVAVLAKLPEWTEVDLPGSIPQEYAPLGWQDLSKMAEQDLIVGAHTLTHPVLARLPASAQIQHEVLGSKLRLEDKLGRSIRHFCYPHGHAANFDERCRETVQRAGFLTAATAIRGLNAPGTDPFTLRRIRINPLLDVTSFSLRASGFGIS